MSLHGIFNAASFSSNDIPDFIVLSNAIIFSMSVMWSDGRIYSVSAIIRGYGYSVLFISLLDLISVRSCLLSHKMCRRNIPLDTLLVSVTSLDVAYMSQLLVRRFGIHKRILKICSNDKSILFEQRARIYLGSSV